MLANKILHLCMVGMMSVVPAAAWPSQSKRTSCSGIDVRQEWRKLTSAEQISYLDAEICLMNLPAETGLSAVTSRYTDLAALHQNLTLIIHDVGQFLPWHRYFVHVHETILRNQCNYSGPIPWWDEQLDAGNFSSSLILSPDTFGSAGSSCVTDGYFANTTLYIGPKNSDTVHCLSRKLNENRSTGSSTASVEMCNSYSNYTTMWECVIDETHPGGHIGVGGVMGDMDSSPGDPLFFLHHGFIDRNWWIWQNSDPTNNMYQLSGYTTQVSPFKEVSLDYVLSSWQVLPDVTINDVMDTTGGYLCYEYDY